ncbi:MAG: cellulase family glycosylhydrolase [Candidatus Goldbacteria bacterium]|nr:cellulase family glycosylhydrolase [Candidatus Goldiibacteriota bacterium]
MHDKKLKLFFCFFVALLFPQLVMSYAINGPDVYSESGKPVKILGVEIPYFLILDEKQQEHVLNVLKETDIKYMKILSCFNGEREYSFQPSLGKFNEKMFIKLDKAVAMASKYGVCLVISLADNNATYGGKEVYKNWLGGSNDDIFFKDRISIENHKNFINRIILRKNTVSGKYYYSDSQIFAWDLCNEMENKSDTDGSVTYSWVNEISSFIKEKDKNHFVMMSRKNPDVSEGKINDYDVALIPDVDFIGYTSDLPGDIIKYNGLYFENVNKPVALCSSIKPSDVELTADVFFENRGSAFFINNAGFFEYKTELTIDLEDKLIKEKINKIRGKMNSLKGNGKLVLNGISVTPGVKSVKISLNFDEPAEGKIFYGRSLPLTMKKEFSPDKNVKIDIDGLEAETKYLFVVKAKTKDKAFVSNVKSFTTMKVKKLVSIPFTMSKNFITAKDGSFFDGNKKYRYIGANNYYVRHAEKKLIDEIFRQAANVGIKVIRVGSNGEAESMDAIDKRDKNRFFRIGPDYFNEDAYKEFDYVLDSAARHNIRIIIHFTDNWEYYGGVRVYTKWAGLTNKNQFWIDETCKKYYKQTIDSFVKRRNTVNGKLYKDDPAIFAYDLMNEPRNEDDPTGVTLAKWIDEMSAYVKSVDPNHMVTTGMEGFFLRDDGTHYSGSDFVLCHKPKNIDFCTFHIYPASEYNNYSMSTTEWLIKKFIDQAHNTLKKPVVMEEFGIPNNNPDFPKAQWIEFMIDTFFKYGGDGANYWFFIDPTYHFGDGNEINWTQTEYMNIFIKTGNVLNK